MFRPMARLAVIVAVLVAAAATAPAASAHFPQTATGTIPAGGNLAVTSSNLPPDATQATITAQPANAGDTVFDKLTKVLSLGATRGQRVVFCAAMYGLLLRPPSPNDPKEDDGNEVLALLMLKMCLHIALTLQPSGQARAAAAACPQQVLSVPVKIRRSAGRYTVRTSTPRLQKRATGKVRMTCRRKGRGIQIRLRSRVRGKPLRSTVGKNLALGYLNPSGTTSATVKTTFAVR